MQNKKQKKTGTFGQIFMFLIFMLIGGACGFVMISNGNLLSDDLSGGRFIFLSAVMLLELYGSIFLQIIIHEAGHLIGGLLSGYRFCSFRVASFMWIKEKGKIKFRKMSLAGTAGQCLMSPPDMKDGKIPFALYNLGGPLINLLTAPIFGAAGYLIPNTYLSTFFYMMSIVGAGSALINGLPMRMTAVNNDGCNTVEMSKSSETLRSFWIQMKVTEQSAAKVRLKDMPSEWFYLPKESEMSNSMTATMAVFYENRLMDLQRFDEAKALIDKLLSTDSAIVGLHKNLLVCDRIYLELIGDKNGETLNSLYNSKEQKRFMTQMANFLTVIRTEYTYALLYEKDEKKISNAKERFEKCAKTHPYTTDVESERELIAFAEQIIS